MTSPSKETLQPESQEKLKVALITGAAKRIGAKTAEALHSNGYQIVLHYNSSSAPAKAIADRLNQQRANSCTTIQADLLKTDDIQRLASASVNYWGRLDLLINNASTFYPTPIENADIAQWDDLLGSNVKAPFFLSQALVPALKSSQGSIINLVDIYAQSPLQQHTIYCIAKAGNAMLVKSLAKELAPDIRVNGVSPGNILWPDEGDQLSAAEKSTTLKKIPLERQGDYQDITNAILYLADAASYVTGQIIAVDGGSSL